ncbi:DUF1722 domain-containing protein [Halioglobus maricola]|uniref:DUF1722 domain-containing protein n=2 Tax=Halioglobus maricola TaxID=2601894 RepID=A0A5P9NPJ0_9GAMM|nr:DUF1722 domain-containing protein [Halioglobus maricola]
MKIPLGISSCLLGQKVRFDSGHKHNPYITQNLGEFFSFQAFCPEVSIGLGTPREPIRLVNNADDDSVRCVGTKDPSLDVTDELVASARAQASWVSSVYGYIFKKDSPSCGMERVKVYRKSSATRDGRGMFAGEIMDMFPNLPVEEEGRLNDARLRENFVKRVFFYKRWCDLISDQPEKRDLVEFHARNKLIYMSHNQTKARELGRLVADIGGQDIDTFCESYLAGVTEIMQKPASRRNHCNVLSHIQGYLKRKLDADDRAELDQMIEQYRLGYIPLIVPITILRHHFRKTPDPYINQSYYMQPHPQELMLHNQL